MSDKHEPELVAGYHALMERARKTIAEAGEHLSLHDLLEASRNAASELQAFSRDEFNRLSYYLKRDLADRARQFRASEKDWADWLRMDLTLVEGKLADLLREVADPTSLELSLLNDAAATRTFHSGEITGLAELHCTGCGQRVEFSEAGVIPACPACGGDEFQSADGD